MVYVLKPCYIQKYNMVSQRRHRVIIEFILLGCLEDECLEDECLEEESLEVEGLGEYPELYMVICSSSIKTILVISCSSNFILRSTMPAAISLQSFVKWSPSYVRL